MGIKLDLDGFEPEERSEELVKKRRYNFSRRLPEGQTCKEVRKSVSQRKRARKYHAKNREKLNSQRRARARSPKGVFLTSRARWLGRGHVWEITEEEFYKLWEEAPKVYDPMAGLMRTAWDMRGPIAMKHTQLVRKDVTKGFTLDNVHIIYRNKPIEEHVPPEGAVDPLGDIDTEELL